MIQYVQESVLPAPSMFEQDNLSTLASFVFFSKVDIVKMVMKEPDLVDTCLTCLKDKHTPPRRQVELCGFLKGDFSERCRAHLIFFYFRIFYLLAKLTAA